MVKTKIEWFHRTKQKKRKTATLMQHLQLFPVKNHTVQIHFHMSDISHSETSLCAELSFEQNILTVY